MGGSSIFWCDRQFNRFRNQNQSDAWMCMSEIGHRHWWSFVANIAETEIFGYVHHIHNLLSYHRIPTTCSYYSRYNHKVSVCFFELVWMNANNLMLFGCIIEIFSENFFLISFWQNEHPSWRKKLRFVYYLVHTALNNSRRQFH